MALIASSTRRARLWGAAVVTAALAVAATGCSSSAPSAESETDALKIGVFVVASAAVLEDIAEAFETELTSAMAPTQVEFDVQNAQGDQSLIASIASNFASSDNHAFAVIGTPAVIALAERVTDKPIIAIAMGDPVGAGVATSLEAPGRNITGSVDYIDPALLLDPIMQIHPDLQRLGTVFDPSNQNMALWVEALKAAAAEYPGLEIIESTITGSGDVATAARGLIGRVEAELIGPDATVLAAVDAIGAAGASSGIPVYLSGGDATAGGIFASVGPDYSVSGSLAAQVAAQVLKDGADPANTAFAAPTGVLINVNQDTMDQLGIELPGEIAETAQVQ